MFFRALFFFSSCLVATLVHSATYYVNASATGNASGLSWSNAMTDLQTALSIAFYGDEIWVAAGTYKPTSSTDRTLSFEMRDNVSVYGGFDGTEAAIAQRNISLNPTTLSGDIGQIGSSSDNSYHILEAENLTTTVYLDGFRVIGGNSNSLGGGLLARNNLSGELVVRNCVFFDNESNNYGGAIYLAACNLTVQNCEFINNDSSNGGAIHNGNNNGGYSTLILRDCTFKGNSAFQGACLDNTLQYQDIIIDRCVFTNNSSDNTVIAIDDFDGICRFMNCLVVGNTVDDFTGQVIDINSFGSGGGDARITNCTFAHNFNIYVNTVQEEMLQFKESNYEVSNCVVYGNTPYQGRQINQVSLVSDCIVEGGYQNGTNIIDADPFFDNPNNNATNSFDVSMYDYSLAFGSPGVNTGNNATIDTTLYPFDVAMNQRIKSAAVDMGCYESSLSVSAPELGPDHGGLFYDQVNATLVFPTRSRHVPFTVHGSNGALVFQGNTNDSGQSFSLPAGLYIARTTLGEVLKFVVR